MDEATKPAMAQTPVSHADLNKIEQTAAAPEEPLRILVLGRTNAGKSSLINALFGKLTTATDILPDTTRTITPFVLQREGLTQALIFDSPGCDSTRFNEKQMHTAALDADLILWVSPANRPDRQTERHCLDALRIFQATQLNRRLPPMLVVMSHIDLLRPASAWQPPYDLSNQQDVKAISIRAALQTVATDLAVPVEQVIPVCLKEGRVYNVNDALWAAILHHQDAALRVRLLRCLDAKRRAEDWTLLRRQLISTGRFLWSLPDKLGKSSGE
jgi:predicted GTPase